MNSLYLFFPCIFLTAPHSTFSNIIIFIIQFSFAYHTARHVSSQYIPIKWKNESSQISWTTKCPTVFANFLKSKWLISGRPLRSEGVQTISYFSIMVWPMMQVLKWNDIMTNKYNKTPIMHITLSSLIK